MAAASTAFTSLRLSTHSTPTPHLRLRLRLRFRTLITSSISPPSSNSAISLSPPTPNLVPNPLPPSPTTSESDDGGDQLYLPWVVRDGKGNFSFRQKTPANLLLESTARKSTKKMKEKKIARGIRDPEPRTSDLKSKPKLSKAARRYYNQNFRDLPQRIAKVLASSGVASRRSCEELIFQGKVTVNGSVCNTPQTKVDPGKDIIYVNGSRLPKKLPPKVYLALNKPKGYICSSGEKETKSVISLFNDFMENWDRKNAGIPRPRLFSVGRLDVNTTGLIIVTNDGEFAQKICHPSFNLSKEYIVTVDGDINKRHLLKISEGTTIEGVQCTPDVVELLPKQPDISRPRLRIVVHEGRHHEVREIVKHAGLQVYALKRVRVGGFKLPSSLVIGKHAELTQAQLKALGWKAGTV